MSSFRRCSAMLNMHMVLSGQGAGGWGVILGRAYRWNVSTCLPNSASAPRVRGFLTACDASRRTRRWTDVLKCICVHCLHVYWWYAICLHSSTADGNIRPGQFLFFQFSGTFCTEATHKRSKERGFVSVTGTLSLCMRILLGFILN